MTAKCLGSRSIFHNKDALFIIFIPTILILILIFIPIPISPQSQSCHPAPRRHQHRHESISSMNHNFFGMPGLPSKRRFACHSSQRTTEPQFCLVQFVHVPSGGITFEDASCPFQKPFLPTFSGFFTPHLQYLLLKNQGKTTGNQTSWPPIFGATTSLFEGRPSLVGQETFLPVAVASVVSTLRPHDSRQGVPEKPEKRSKNVKARTGKRLQKKNHSEQSWSLKMWHCK